MGLLSGLLWMASGSGCGSDPMRARFAADASAGIGSTGAFGECQLVSTTPVAWNQETGMGTPQERFADFAGSCQAPFQWDGRPWSDALTALPLQGQSTITVSVALEKSSGRWLTFSPPALVECASQLQLDGTVTLDLPEGNVAHQRPFTLTASNWQLPSTLTAPLDEQDFGSWVSIRMLDQVAAFSGAANVSPVALACSGQVLLGYRRSQEGGSAAVGPLATWSTSNCSAGAEAIDIQQPWKGVDIATAISLAFGQKTTSGTWSDGTTTTLTLTTSLPTSTACADLPSFGDVPVTIPVDVVASTADGRVRGLAGRGSIRVTVYVPQSDILRLELSFGTDLVCASRADSLAYGGADCATVRQVSAQLDVNTEPINSIAKVVFAFLVYERQSSK